MKITQQENGMGLIIVVCKCCNYAYKAHKLENALRYSLTPNYGCHKCRGILSTEKISIEHQEFKKKKQAEDRDLLSKARQKSNEDYNAGLWASVKYNPFKWWVFLIYKRAA